MLAVATWGFALVLGVVLRHRVDHLRRRSTSSGSGPAEDVGAELELAPNRKPYYDDEGLEGPRLERVQLFGLLTLAVIVIALPLYWLFEPSRQAGAREEGEARLVGWGEDLFATTADGGFNCAGCHGGMKATGGAAPYTITDPNTGAGAVGHLERARPQYRDVPVQRGGGALHPRVRPPVLTDVTVGHRRRRPHERAADQLGDRLHQEHPAAGRGLRGLPTRSAKVAGSRPTSRPRSRPPSTRPWRDGTANSVGEAIFNLSLDSGAYSCARCHTSGWSYGNPLVTGGGAIGTQPDQRRRGPPVPERGGQPRLRSEPTGVRQEVRPARTVEWPHAGLRHLLHPGTARGAGRVHPEPVMRTWPASSPSGGSPRSAGSPSCSSPSSCCAAACTSYSAPTWGPASVSWWRWRGCSVG